MVFTHQQEEELLRQYNKLIWRTVHRFQRRASYNTSNNADDLYQEAAIVFVLHLRKAKDMDEVQNHIPIRDMINAMSRFVLRDQVISYPKRTTEFRHTMQSMPRRSEYTDVDLDSNSWVTSIDDTLEKIAMDEFLASLSPVDRSILSMKCRGMDNRAIGKLVGENDLQIHRHIKRLRKQYAAYAA